MKPILLCVLLGGIMLLASIACSLGSVGVEWETTPTHVSRTLADQMTPKLPAFSTESAPEGGFTTGTPIDAANLPHGQRAGTDGPYSLAMPCPGDSTEPAMKLLTYGTLCLNNFPTAPASPGFTVTLIDPTGHTYSESFTYNQDEIVDSRGEHVGRAQDEDDIESLLAEDITANPGVYINLAMRANLPTGNWSVSANTQDGSINIGPTSVTLSRDDYMDANILVDLDTNPFIDPPKHFTSNETIYFVGQGYPPNTIMTVAFYQEDPSTATPAGFPYSYTAKYATSVTTDSMGSFQVQFIVDSTTLRGRYCGFAGQVTDSDYVWLKCDDAANDTLFTIE